MPLSDFDYQKSHLLVTKKNGSKFEKKIHGIDSFSYFLIRNLKLNRNTNILKKCYFKSHSRQ